MAGHSKYFEELGQRGTEYNSIFRNDSRTFISPRGISMSYQYIEDDCGRLFVKESDWNGFFRPVIDSYWKKWRSDNGALQYAFNWVSYGRDDLLPTAAYLQQYREKNPRFMRIGEEHYAMLDRDSAKEIVEYAFRVMLALATGNPTDEEREYFRPIAERCSYRSGLNAFAYMLTGHPVQPTRQITL